MNNISFEEIFQALKKIKNRYNINEDDYENLMKIILLTKIEVDEQTIENCNLKGKIKDIEYFLTPTRSLYKQMNKKER